MGCRLLNTTLLPLFLPWAAWAYGTPCLTERVPCACACACHRFTEILQCAEGLSEEQIKQAIRKSRIVFNRQGVVTRQQGPGSASCSQGSCFPCSNGSISSQGSL